MPATYQVKIQLAGGVSTVKATKDIKVATDLLTKFPDHRVWIEIDAEYI